MRFERFAVAVLLILGLGACGDASGLLEGEPYMRGVVLSITHRATASGILVQGVSHAQEPCDLQAVADAETRYLRRTRGGAVEADDRAGPAVGDTVEVYVDGPVMESCPLQGRAAAIVRVP